MKLLLILTLFLNLFFCFDTSSQQRVEAKKADTKESHESLSNSIYNLDSLWINQEGKKISLKNFEGHPLVLTMFYSRCKTACPIITKNLKTLDKNLNLKSKDVRFVMVSFDKTETAESFKDFMNKHKLDPNYWTVLKGSDDELRELAVVLGIKFKENENGEFSHSNVIALLDRFGNIKKRHEGLKLEQEVIDSFVSAYQNFSSKH